MSDQHYQGIPQRATEQMGDAVNAFTPAASRQPAHHPKPHMVVNNDNQAPQPSKQTQAKTVGQSSSREKHMAKAIVEADNPVVIITLDMAESYGNMSKYLYDTFPGTPVIFEDAKTEHSFRSAAWSDHTRSRQHVAGHFTDNANGHTISNASSIDVVVVLGTPTQAMKDTFPRAQFFANKKGQIDNRVNFALINDLRKKSPKPA